MTELHPTRAGSPLRGLRTELLALLAAAVLPLAVLHFAVVLRNHRRAVAEAEAGSVRLAALLASSLSELLTRSRESAAAIARHAGAMNLVEGVECGSFLRRYVLIEPYLVNAIVTDAEGRLICSVEPAGDLVRVDDAAWFPEATRSDSALIGPALKGRITGVWLVSAVAPIHDAAGQRSGYLALSLSLDRLSRLLAAIPLPPAGTMTVVDGTGRILLRSLHPEQWVGSFITGTAAGDRVLADAPGSTFRAIGSDSVDRIWGLAAVPGTRWRAYVGTSAAITQRRMLGQSLAGLLFFALALGLGLLGAARLGGRITNSLDGIRATLAAARAGDDRPRAREAGPSEVVEVARGLNALLDARAGAEAKLRASERRYRRIVQTSSDGILTLDTDGRITYANHRLRQLTGYAVEDLLGRPVFELLPHGARAAARATLVAQDPGLEGTRDVKLHRPDGRTAWVLASSTYIRDETGAVSGVLTMLTDITQRREEEDELRLARTRLERLAAALEDAREAERSRVAREIHDELGQALASLRIDATWIGMREVPPAVGARLREMTDLIDGTAEAVRRIGRELRPAVLDDLGLAAAAEAQARELARRSGLQVRADVRELPAIAPGLGTAVFRILQEALTNVVRHAQAATVDIQLAVADGRLRLRVADDGAGLPPDAMHRGRLGLLGMGERARAWGGSCRVERGQAGGTVVTLDVPVAPPPGAPA